MGNATRSHDAPEAVTEQASTASWGDSTTQVRPLGTTSVHRVEEIRLSTIDVDDHTYMFRAVLRANDLARSLAAQGQHTPILLRRLAGRSSYQVVSGFRRLTAARELATARPRSS